MKSLFVGNLNFQTTEADLTALFQPFGLVGAHLYCHRSGNGPLSRFCFRGNAQ